MADQTANSQITISAGVQKKYGDLLKMIFASPSMDTEEKKYWVSALSIMTPPQITELRDILTDEQKNLQKQKSSKAGNSEEKKSAEERQKRIAAERAAREKSEQNAEQLLEDFDFA